MTNSTQNNLHHAYIYDAIRTPRGRAKNTGALHALTPFELLDTLYNALEQRTGLKGDNVEDVILGCVTQADEQAANIARTSVMYSQWPQHIPGLTVNRYCSSGIDALHIAAMKVASGMNDMVVAGGVEMMSRIPMLSDNALAFSDPALARRLGMFMMGSGADLIASLYQVSREQADSIALASHQRATQARAEGRFSSIIPVFNPVTNTWVDTDELIRADASLQALSSLPASFAELGAKGVDQAFLNDYPQLETIRHVHTVGNSPAMADAACALLIGNAAAQKRLGAAPKALIKGMITVNDDPNLVVSGCVLAARKLMEKQGLSTDDIDLFEIHEAFAATLIKCQQDLGIDDKRLNVNGGCIALGHPLGATGGIMTGTLLDELERRQLRRGIVAVSGAAGAGTALLLERV